MNTYIIVDANTGKVFSLLSIPHFTDNVEIYQCFNSGEDAENCASEYLHTLEGMLAFPDIDAQIFELNDFLIPRLAVEFVTVLRDSEYLTSDELIEADRLNEIEPDANICHLHDFCDANEAMAELPPCIVRKAKDH